MKHLQRFAGILTAFCLMIILFFTSVEAVVYWNPGYFEKEYTKYQVLDDLPSMTMDDLLNVTSQMMAYLKGKRADLHVTTHMGGETREFFNEREIAHMEDVQGLFLKAIVLRLICVAVCVIALLFMVLSKADLRTLFPSSLCMGNPGLIFCIDRSTGCYYIHKLLRNILSFSTHMFLIMTCAILDLSTDMPINIVPWKDFSWILRTYCFPLRLLSLILWSLSDHDSEKQTP